jgi:hypothetical protein
MLMLVPSVGRADDPQQTLRLLPDADSECHYVEFLVKSAQDTAQGADRAREDSEAAEAAGNLQLAANKITIARVVLQASTESWTAIAAMLQAMEDKHGALPACAVSLKEEENRGRTEARGKADAYTQRFAALTKRMVRG